MHTYLVVLERPVSAQSLRFGLLDLVSQLKPAQFVLLQATRPLPGETPDEARCVAFANVLNTRSRLMTMGVPVVDTVVGDPLPKKAIAAELGRGGRTYDGIVLTSKPPELRRLLHCDLARQLERKFGLPVAYVEIAGMEGAAVG